MTRSISAVLFVAACFSGIASAQVPPPPPLPGQSELFGKLVRAIENKDVVTYANLLEPDVKVYEDGELVADSRDKWIKSYGAMLKAKGVVMRVDSAFSSAGHILLIEYFNSANSWGRGLPADCCWGYNAASYEVSDGKVSAVYRVKGGDKATPIR